MLGSEAEPPAPAKLSGAGKERVGKLIEGAKKEGQLTDVAAGFHMEVQAKRENL